MNKNVAKQTLLELLQILLGIIIPTALAMLVKNQFGGTYLNGFLLFGAVLTLSVTFWLWKGWKTQYNVFFILLLLMTFSAACMFPTL